jgi:hypothetical protein
MKHFFLFVTAFFMLVNVSNAQEGELTFEKSKQRFGFVHEGDTVKLIYPFQNTGKGPLTISEIKVTCGCTVVDFPTTPILPGQKGEIHVSFDTHDKYDRQDRTIEVISTAKKPVYPLRFKGVVLKPSKKA